jgi:hypothetical protein
MQGTPGKLAAYCDVDAAVLAVVEASSVGTIEGASAASIPIVT